MRKWIAAGALAAGLLAACTSTTAGTGTGPTGETTSSARSSTAGPSTSGPRSSGPPASASGSSTSPPPASSSPAPTSTSASPLPPTDAQRQAALQAQVGADSIAVVAVPAGREAISYDQATHVRFWANSGATTVWQQIGSSAYPYNPAVGGPPGAQASGALLTGMADATFIVTGLFTGDGSGNAVAFTTGPPGSGVGWGSIKAEPDGGIGPSGAPVGDDQLGLSFGFAFDGGRLVTQDCALNQPIAACGGPTTIVKYWLWTGAEFAQVPK